MSEKIWAPVHDKAYTNLILAQHTKSALGQAVILQQSDDYQNTQLYLNENLKPHIWDQLEKIVVQWLPRAFLLSNAPTKKQAELILTESNQPAKLTAVRLNSKFLKGKLLNKLLRDQSPALAAQLIIHRAGLSKKVAKKLWERVYSDVIQTKLSESYYLALVKMISIYNLPTDEQLLVIINQDVRARESDRNTARIIDYRPHLIKALLESDHPEKFYEPISASRFITEDTAHLIYDFLSKQSNLLDKPNYNIISNLIDNPSLSLKMRADLSSMYINNQELIPAEVVTIRQENWFGLRDRLKRQDALGCLPVTGNWINPSPNQSDEVKTAMGLLGSWRYPALLNLEQKFSPLYDQAELPDNISVKTAIDPYLDHLGVDAWKIFLQMAPEFEGSIPDLLQVVSSILKK